MCELHPTCLIVLLGLSNVYLIGMGIGSIVVGVKIERYAGDDSYIVYMSRFPSSKDEEPRDSLEEKSILERGGLVFLSSGVVLIAFGLVGFLVIVLKRKGLLIAYMVLLCLVLFCEIAACTLGFMFLSNIKTGLDVFLAYTLRTHYTGPYLDLQLPYDSLDQELKDIVDRLGDFNVSTSNGSSPSTQPTEEETGKILVKYQDLVLDYIQAYYKNTTTAMVGEKMSLAWDMTMLRYDCCGNNNYSEFQRNSRNWNRHIFFTIEGSPYGRLSPFTVKMKVPPACCKHKSGPISRSRSHKLSFKDMPGCLTTALAETTNFDSCFSEIKGFFNGLVYALTFLSLTLIIVEVFTIINAWLIWKSMKSEEKDGEYEIYGPAHVATQNLHSESKESGPSVDIN